MNRSDVEFKSHAHGKGFAMMLFFCFLCIPHPGAAQYVIVPDAPTANASEQIARGYFRTTFRDLGMQVIQDARELESGEFGAEFTIGVMKLDSGAYDIAVAMSNVLRLEGGQLYRHEPAIYHMLHEIQSLKVSVQKTAEKAYSLILGADSGPWGDYWRRKSNPNQ